MDSRLLAIAAIVLITTIHAEPAAACSVFEISRCLDITVVGPYDIQDVIRICAQADEFKNCIDNVRCMRNDTAYQLYLMAVGFTDWDTYACNNSTLEVMKSNPQCSAGAFQQYGLCYANSFRNTWYMDSVDEICEYYKRLYSCENDWLAREPACRSGGVSNVTMEGLLRISFPFTSRHNCSITTTPTGKALQCYVCNSGEHFEQEECETDTLSDKWLKNCYDEGLKDNKTYIMCRKFTQDVEGDYRVVRTCATGGQPEKGCVLRRGTGTGNKLIKLAYCECIGDGCNAARPSIIVSLANSLPSILLLVAVAVITANLC